jgi:chlorobactene glucosyltransferase
MIDLLIGPVSTVLAASMLVVLVVNLIILRRASRRAAAYRGDRPFVSVLIPARNEADCIEDCLHRVLRQTGLEFEVLVVDDESDDDTYALAAAIDDDRLSVMRGARLPEGWTGKNWACHQLVRRAKGDVYCFVDVDTQLEPGALAAAVDSLESERADLLSLLVAADYRTAPQALLLPMVTHALLALFPLTLMNSRRLPRVVLALGPFLLVRASAYAASGGHAARPSEVVDDVHLSRAVKLRGGRVRLVDGTELARTSWYRDTRGIYDGFSKNAFGALDRSNALAALVCFGLVPLLVLPFARLLLDVLGGDIDGEVVVQVGLILAARLATSVAGRDPLWTVPLHPIAVLFWGTTLARSAVLAARDATIEWRAREVPIATR